jgi:hypothetical protein
MFASGVGTMRRWSRRSIFGKFSSEALSEASDKQE